MSIAPLLRAMMTAMASLRRRFPQSTIRNSESVDEIAAPRLFDFAKQVLSAEADYQIARLCASSFV